jgi:hypothetical protein
MKYLVLIFLAGCTTVGTLHNPACIIMCQNQASDQITTNQKEQLK